MKNTFSASKTFFGGSAIVIQYHDVLKPVYLTAIFKMLLNKDLQFGLPFDILKSFSIPSIVEWYKTRNYFNPLKLLDPKRLATNDQLNQMLNIVLKDKSIYTLTPLLNSIRLLIVSEQNHLNVPMYIYSEQYEENILYDINQLPLHLNYIYGSIKDLVDKIPANSTYIFSNIELLKEAIFSIDAKKSVNFILVSDYNYNFSNNQYKYNFSDLLSKEFKPFIVINNISIFNNLQVTQEYLQLLKIK